ncbi:hypothetical protein V8F06_008760 [Rhypophila decipiens]
MSGLETLTALGLACNVFQVLGFANEVYTIGRAICERGETADSAASLAKSMSNLFKIMEEITTPVGSTSKSPSTNDTRMREIAKDCNEAALELKAEIDKYSAAASSQRQWTQSNLAKLVAGLEQRLQAHQNTLQPELLVKIYSNTEAVEQLKLYQEAEFKKFDSTLCGFVAQFSDGKTRMEELLVHVTKETTTDVKDHVTGETEAVKVHELDGTMKDSNLRQDMEKKRERLIKSLKYPTMNDRPNQIADPHAETFEWIFTGPPLPNADEASSRFSAWLRDPAQQLFRITGKPGSGKSTFVKFLVDDPRTRDGLTSYECSARDVVILSHFIWGAGQAMERSVRGMLCSLIYQLIDENDPMGDKVLKNFPKTKAKDSCSDWSEKELRNVLGFLLGDSSKAFCFFIDGLDEISETDGQLKLMELIREMRAGSNMKMCISSRPEPILKKHLGLFPTVRMQDLTQADIFKFTSSLLRRRLLDNSIDLNTTEYQKLVYEVCWKAEGVFLWVVLAVRDLLVGIEKGDEMRQLERRLELMPSELQDLYRAMRNRLGTENQLYEEDAATYFNLVILFYDPSITSNFRYTHLSTPLQVLLATDSNLANRALLTTPEPLPSDDELRTLANKMARRVETSCLGLLDSIKEWDASGNEVKLEFIHRSAKEFLETDAKGRALLELDTSTKQERVFRMVKARLAQSILSWLGNSGIIDIYNPDSGSQFITDIDELRESNHISETQKLQLALLSRPLFKPYLWLCTDVPVKGHINYPDFLGAAAWRGCLSFLEQAMSTGPCWGVTAGPVSVPYMSYLVVMALAGLTRFSKWDDGVKTVRWLLKHDVNPNFPTRPYRNVSEGCSIPTSPLKEVVGLLMNQGLPLDYYAPLVDILGFLVQAGGDLSSPLILVLEENPNKSQKLERKILTSHGWYTRVYIEVETALVIELFVRKYVRHNAADAASVKQLTAMLESSPRSELPVKRVTVAKNLSFEEDSPFDLTGANDEKPFWATSDPACLSRIQEHLKGDLESNCPSAPHDPSDCEGDPVIPFEISTSCIRDVVKENAETGEQTFWVNIFTDWISRDILWRSGDPRLNIPEAWTS